MAARKTTRKRTPKTPKRGRNSKGQFLAGYYQPCHKGSRIRKATPKRRK